MSLEGKKLVLGITGSIAAYKVADLTRRLVKAGAEVQPVMTAAAMVPPVWRRVMNPRVRAWRRQFYPEIEDWRAYNRHETPLPR